MADVEDPKPEAAVEATAIAPTEETKPKEHDTRLVALGGNVRARRVVMGMSQADLAKKANVDRSLLTRFERGSKNLTVEVLLRISDALQCTAGFLMEGVGRRR